ncbi:MAG: transposase [Nannocystaceae bacterium]
MKFPTHQVQATPEGKPKPEAQRNFTDPDSRIMKKGKDGYMQGYNAQAVVDAECQVIVAADVTNQAPDTEHFVPMLKLTISNCAAVPDKVSADAGYWSEVNEKAALQMGIDPYIATGRLRRGEVESPPSGRISATLGAKERMHRKTRTKKGKAIYARRKAIVEPVFGQVKAPRGLRQFLVRGSDKVRREFSLISLTHNILKLWRASAAPA